MIELLRIVACLIRMIANAQKELADLKEKHSELEALVLSHFADPDPDKDF